MFHCMFYFTCDRSLGYGSRPGRRALVRRRRAGQLGRVGDGAWGVEQPAQQAPVSDAHDDDRAGEPNHELKDRPEERVSHQGAAVDAGRPADLAAVSGGVDVGVEPDRKHDDGTDQPRDEAGDDRVARSSIAAWSEWMYDG